MDNDTLWFRMAVESSQAWRRHGRVRSVPADSALPTIRCTSDVSMAASFTTLFRRRRY